MRLWLHRLELFVDVVIPYLLFLLIGLLTMEYFFGDYSYAFADGIIMLDYVVMTFLVTDIGFKYHRAKGVNQFFRRNWLEIIAVMPFALLFRMFDRLIILRGVETEIDSLRSNHKIEATFLRLVRQLGEDSVLLRSNRLLGFFHRSKKRIKSKVLNVLQFYEKPSGRHWHHER